MNARREPESSPPETPKKSAAARRRTEAQPGVEAGGRFLHLYLFRPQAPTRAASGEIGGEIHAAGFDLQLAVYAADRLVGGKFQRPFHFGDAADRRGGLFGIGQPQQHGAGERPEFRLAGQPPREQFG